MTNTVDLIVDDALSLRMAFLMTHYRSPCEVGPNKIKEARKVLRRFALACEPCLHTAPPVEIISAVSDDLNTPKAIAIMHGYRKRKEGKKLFASLRFLGFWDDFKGIDELKTLPPDHIWNQPQVLGFDAINADLAG